MLGGKITKRRLGEEARQPLGYFPLTIEGNGAGSNGSAKSVQPVAIASTGYVRRSSSAAAGSTVLRDLRISSRQSASV